MEKKNGGKHSIFLSWNGQNVLKNAKKKKKKECKSRHLQNLCGCFYFFLLSFQLLIHFPFGKAGLPWSGYYMLNLWKQRACQLSRCYCCFTCLGLKLKTAGMIIFLHTFHGTQHLAVNSAVFSPQHHLRHSQRPLYTSSVRLELFQFLGKTRNSFFQFLLHCFKLFTCKRNES